MAKVEVIKGGQRVENVVITTPQPMKPSGALPPDIGYVEIGVSDDRGSIWMTGQGPPTQDAGQTGDMYLDMDTGDVYQWNGTEWELQGTFAPSTDTPAEILAKLITVDGAGSLLDADTLDGMDSTQFATAVQMGIAEGNITTLQGEMDAVEAKNVSQDTAIAGKANAVHTHPQSDITNLVADLALKAPLASPALTGNPTAPTPAPGDADTSIATTAFVGAALAALPPSGIGEAPNDGQTYGRKSLAWATVVGGAIISDTPPAGPAPGQMWYESDSGNTFIWYADADSSQWVQVNIQPAIATNPNAGLTAQTRNRLVNPCFQIAQETTAGVNTNGSYAADQWRLDTAGTGFTPLLIVSAKTSSAGISPAYVTISGGATPKPALAATDYLGMSQLVEGTRISDFGWGTAQATAIVVSFTGWTAAGTYALSIRNAAQDRSYVVPITLAAAVTSFSVAIPGCTTGTWATDTGVGLQLSFMLAVGTTYQTASTGSWLTGNFFGVTGQSNLLSTASQVQRFTRVGLYLDPLNTGLAPRWETPDEAAELAACQRYYEKPNGASIMGYQNVGNAIMVPVAFKVSKRIVPACAVVNWVQVSNCSGQAAYDTTTEMTNWGVTTTATGVVIMRGISGTINARM